MLQGKSDMSNFQSLVEIMARLREEGGCAWDRAQTHASLRPYLIEEAYEVVDAITREDPALLQEELGDLLLQILFHARIASENSQFDINNVIESISDKMVRRHPHVFAKARAATPEAVSLQWEEIKKTLENKNHSSRVGGVPQSFPSLLRAAKITKKASRAGFDWSDVKDVQAKVEEELAELRDAVSEGKPASIEHEFGDVLFALVNLARFLGVNPELALAAANNRFEKRFEAMEEIAEKSGHCIESTDLETLDRFWEEAKRSTK